MSANLRSTAVALVTALLLAAAIVPAVSAADCNDGITNCDLTGAEQTDADAVTIESMSTVLPLVRDAEDPSVHSEAYGLYLSLLNGASMPAGVAPSVGVDLRQVTDASGAATVESTVAILTSRDGENGWQVISRTVTAGAADQQAIGVAAVDGEASFNPTEGSSKQLTGIRFDQSVEVEVSEVVEAFATRTAPTFGITPVVEGDTPWRITEAARPTVPVADVLGTDPVGEEGVTATSDPVAGEVRYTLVEDLDAVNEGLPAQFGERSLADLVALEGTAPGMGWATDALLVTQADNLDDASGPFPVEPPPLPTDTIPTVPSSLVVGANDPQTGQLFYANNDNTIVAGTQLYQTNVDLQAHPIVCADEDGRTRADLCDTTGFNNAGEVLPVEGTEDLEPGTYYYVCRVHTGNPSQQSGMWGTFTVVG